MNSRILFSILVVTISSIQAFAQNVINGPEVVVTGTTHEYTYSGLEPVAPTWVVTGGTKVSNTSTTVTIQWSASPGSGTIQYKYKTTVMASKTVTIGAPPAAPTTTNAARCGTGTVTLTASGAPTEGTYKWYSASSGGTLLGTASSYTTPSLSATTSYWVSAVSSIGLEGPRSQATATIYAMPTSPQANPASYSSCGPSTFALTPKVIQGEPVYTYKWYTASTGGSPVAVTNGPFNTGTISANTDYYFSRTVDGGICESPRATVTISIYPVPSTSPIAPDAAQCGTNSATLTASGGTGYRWYSAATGGTLLSSSATYNTPVISATTSYYVAFANANGCIGPREPVQAIINSIPGLPLSDNSSRCQTGTVTLTASGTPSGGSYRWYSVSSGGSPLETLGTYTTPSISSTTSYWVSSVSSQGCEGARKQVSALVVTPPSAPTISITGNSSSCDPASFSLSVNLVSGDPMYDYKWYSAATGGLPIEDERSYNTPVISATTTYYGTRSPVGIICESSRTPVTVNISGPSTVQATGADVTRYGTGNVVLTAGGGSNGYKWYAASTGGTTIATTSSLTTPSVAQSTSYYVTALNSFGCEGTREEIKAVVLDVSNLLIGSATVNGNTVLSVPGTHDAYQWIKNGTDIAGATASTYTVTSNGRYAVRLTPENNPSGSYTTPEMIVSTMVPGINEIMGPNFSAVHEAETYYFTTDVYTLDRPTWTVTNGTVVRGSVVTENSHTRVTVKWTQSGPGTISVKQGPSTLATATVIVAAECFGSEVPASPAGQNEFYIAEGNSQVISLTAPAGASVQWFDLDYVDYERVFLTGNNFTTPVLTSSITYKARSFNSTTYCASPMIPVQVNVFQPAVAQSVRQEAVRISGITSAEQLTALTTSQKSTNLTYMDGLGRPIQQIVRNASPLGYDIVQPVEFDAQGRSSKSYLPYVVSSTAGIYQPDYSDQQSAFYNNTADKVADDVKPYASSVFESSPLGRVLEQGGVGDAWQPGSSHTQRLTYTFNNVNEVREFKSDGSSTGFYAADKLAKTVVVDPDGNQAIVFNDLAGRTLLKKRQIDESIDGAQVPYLDTYYIYDDFGRLKYIISPKGVAALQSGSWTLTQTILDNYTHQFVYDKRGNLIEKKVPGQGWAYYIYDRLNRLILAQDQLMREQNRWMFLKYDFKGRPIMNGFYKNTTQLTRASLQTAVFDYYTETHATYPISKRSESRGAVHGYTNQSYPITNTDGSALEYMNVTYYDNHDFDNNGTYPSYTSQGLPGEGVAGSPEGLATGGKKIIMGTSTWLTSYVFYDSYRRPIQVRSNNHLNPTLDNLSTSVYDFEGKTLITKNYHHAGGTNITSVINKFEYDAQGRLLKVYQNNNGAPSDQLMAQYEYNELGQLVDKKLHETSGNSFLQSIDYRYGINGRLASINNAQLNVNSQNNDEANDYFGMEFLYEKTESALGNAALYNGNVSAVKWKGIGGEAGLTEQKSYTYTYDKSNKLETAISKMHDGTAWAMEAGALNESMTYDHNGNIRSLQRNQRKHQLVGVISSYISETIDDLTYSYNTAIGDQLLKVTDASTGLAAAGFNNSSSGTASDFTYDNAGNLTADNNKGISDIQYNLLGKVQRMEFADGRVMTYTYDAAGSKLAMEVQSGSVNFRTDYVNGFVYENGGLSFFGSSEGRVVKKGSVLEYQYALSDNQGNTRVVFTSAEPEVDSPSTGFESDPGTFENFPTGGNHCQVPLFNNTAGGTSSQLLNGGYNGQVGVAKSFKVFPGDKVKIQAYAKFESGGSSTSTSFASALLSAFSLAPPGLGETGTAAAALDTWGAFVDGGAQSGGTAPQAFVNIVVFDKDHSFLDAAWDQISEDAEQIDVSPDVDHDEMVKEYLIKEAGYVYVYISNNSPVKTYFDDVTITHTPTNVIQYNEYYPFGLQTSNSWTRENNKNDFLYNAGSELNRTTGYYDLFYRNYDAALGRFIQVDPKAVLDHSVSSYVYAGNNPIMFNDPLGDQYNWKKMQDEAEASEMFRRGAAGAPPFWAQSEAVIDRLAELANNSGNSSDSHDGGYSTSDPNEIAQIMHDFSAGAPIDEILETAEEGLYKMYSFETNVYMEGKTVVYEMSATTAKGDDAQQGGPGDPNCPTCPNPMPGPSLTDMLLAGIGTAGLVAEHQTSVINASRSGLSSGKLSSSSPRVYSKVTATKVNMAAKSIGWGLTLWSIYNTEAQFEIDGDVGRRRYNHLNNGVGVVYPIAGLPLAAGDYLGQKYSNEIVNDVSQPGGFLFEGMKSVLGFFGIPTGPGN